jgi:glycerophosphoryl diester phosphodiesterase
LGKDQAKKIVDKVLNLFAEMKAEKQVVYISFDINMVNRIREINKKAKVQYLNGDIAPDILAKEGIDIDYHFSVFKAHPEWISLAKNKKVILNAWTVNDSSMIDELLQSGFDLITTNEPELVFDRIKNQ